jgi:hypothetical protein
MNQKIIIIIVLVGLAMLALGGFIGFSLGLSQGKVTNINSYEECVAAGYPVQESYPERCSVPGGNSYTNPDASPLVSLEGRAICLEHRGGGQFHTLECAAGFRAENGKTYTIKDGNADLTELMGSDQRIRIEGTVEEKESDRYQSAGELTVDSFEVIE